jgi:formate hydrogenlyase subunit 3/multisubunit Na+/H+ antiporter MnhD subunit
VRGGAAVTGDGWAVFVLCLVGFGSKAGIVPLHAWLPRAHPKAPSHVSTLMAAAMVNMGVALDSAFRSRVSGMTVG